MMPHNEIATARTAPPAVPLGFEIGLARPRRVAIAVVCLIAALALGAASDARAWPAAVHVEIARQAATIAPPDLLRQIERNEKAFAAGITSALRGRGHSDDASSVLSAVRAGSAAVIEGIESHEPFREVVRDLGRLAVYAAEANNPLKYANGDARAAGFRADYDSYLGSAFARFEVVFYGDGRDLRDEEALAHMLTRTGQRGADLLPLLGQEYRRIGRIDGIALFDDKSTAFGIGSIAFSHAVSDLAAVYRYVWLRSGGADGRRLPVTLPSADLSASEAGAQLEALGG